MTLIEILIALLVFFACLFSVITLIVVIARAARDFTSMVQQLGRLVAFVASMEAEIKHLRAEFKELADIIEYLANGGERLSDKVRQKLRQATAGDD